MSVKYSEGDERWLRVSEGVVNYGPKRVLKIPIKMYGFGVYSY